LHWQRDRQIRGSAEEKPKDALEVSHQVRVLHVFKLYRPSHGGIVHILEKLARGLANQVQTCVLVSRERGLGKLEVVDGITVRRTTSLGQLLALPLSPTFPLWFWYYAKRSDVVNYHYPFPLVDLTVFLWFPKQTALVVHWHSEIVAQARIARLLSPMIRRCLQRADRIIVASPEHIKGSPYLARVAEKCTVIPFGADVEEWRSLTLDESAKIDDLKQRYPRLIVAVGRLVPYKGFDVLLRAMRNVNAMLFLIGSGPLEQMLRKQAADLNITERVIFHGGVDATELKIALHAATLFVLPSVSENEAFGIVQLEAMACGKPIVNTALRTAVPWVARDKQEALTVPPGDPDALAAALTRLLDDPSLSQQLGNNGLTRARNCFSNEVFFARTLETYQASVRERRRIPCMLS